MTVTETSLLSLRELAGHLTAQLERFEVGELSAVDAAVEAAVFGRIKRMAQTGELLCLNRAATTSGVRRRDDVDGSKWASDQLGTTPGHAAELLKLAGALETAPHTREALLGGEISVEKAAEVVRTEKTAPGSEADMLERAEQGSLTDLKRRGRKMRAAAIGPDRQAAQVHRGRYLRGWIDDDGAGRGAWSLPVAEHAHVMALLEPITDQIFRDARRQGRREPIDAYRADALVGMATGALNPSPTGRASDRQRAPDGSTTPSHNDTDDDQATGTQLALPDTPPPAGDTGPAGDDLPAGDGPDDTTRSSPATSRRTTPAGLVVRVGHRLLAGAPGVTGDRSAPLAEGDEVAEVVGYGPIPIAQIRTWLAQGAFAAVVTTADHDHLDVHHVLHLRRRSPLIDHLWLPNESRPRAGPDRDTTAHHIKVIVQLTEAELIDPALAALRTAMAGRGVDVTALVHRGRRPNAVQRTALQWRSPDCAVLGCTNRIRLEADHTIEWHLTHHTTLTELEHLCRDHHRMKTHDGYRLTPGTGKRPLHPPADPHAPP